MEHRLVDTALAFPGQGQMVKGSCQFGGIASRGGVLLEGDAEPVHRNQKVLSQGVEDTLTDRLIVQQAPPRYADADVNQEDELSWYVAPLRDRFALNAAAFDEGDFLAYPVFEHLKVLGAESDHGTPSLRHMKRHEN